MQDSIKCKKKEKNALEPFELSLYFVPDELFIEHFYWFSKAPLIQISFSILKWFEILFLLHCQLGILSFLYICLFFIDYSNAFMIESLKTELSPLNKKEYVKNLSNST